MTPGMKLYHSPTSPFVRKVMVLLHEAGATDRVALVPVMGTPLDPGTLPVDRNPSWQDPRAGAGRRPDALRQPGHLPLS
jgi:glutathione S-transferase